MKKIITGTILTAMLLTLGTAGTIFAASGNNYTDSDNNGICDNIGICSDNENGKKNCQNGNAGIGAGYIDADNDGVCDNAETGKKNCQNGNEGTGAGNTDADNDGICDNTGTGAGYIDADNDGICDNAGRKNCNNSGKCRRAEK